MGHEPHANDIMTSNLASHHSNINEGLYADTMPLPALKVLLWLLLLLPVASFVPARLKARRRRCGAPTTLTIGSSKQSTVATTATTQTALYATITQEQHYHRNIVVLSHNVSQDVADGFFDTNHLLHGRVDVLVRCANAALWISNNIRKDTTVFLMLFPHNITIEIQGCSVAGLNPDERTMALYVQRLLLLSNLGSQSGDGDTEGTKETSEDESSRQRLSTELSRLEETKRQRPETNNPFKPGAIPKSERQRLSVARKQREAMVRRIKKAAARSQDDNSNNAGGGGGDNNNNNNNAPPVGFALHQNDSLPARLEQFSATGPVLMLNELGEPLANVLESLDHDTTDTYTTRTTTTLILGDQIGYAESDEKVLAESRGGRGVRQVSLGPLSLLTSQCITISHHYLDLLSVK
jgi:tRNA pseudouridine-54 N-methylase